MKPTNVLTTHATWLGVVAGLTSIALTTAAVHAGSQSRVRFQTVQVLGGPTPRGDLFSSDFEPTRLNNRGQLAFTADVVQVGTEAVFLQDDDTLTEVIRFADAAPGGGIFAAGELGNIGLNDAGDMAITFTLEPLMFDPYIRGGVYRYSPRNRALSVVAAPGMVAPGGGFFLGVGFNSSLNNEGALVFTGVITTGDQTPNAVFLSSKKGVLSRIAGPGDVGPQGSFATAYGAWINDGGDIAFGGAYEINGRANAFYRRASNGAIIQLPAPPDSVGEGVGGLNNRGEVVITSSGDATPGQVGIGGIYLYTRGTLQKVAAVGSPAPGGAFFSNVAGATLSGQVGLNNRGEVAFNAALDNGDEGLFVYSNGVTRVIAHIGTVIPGLGTIHSLEQTGQLIIPPPPAQGFTNSGIGFNDHGQVAFACTLEDGRTALVIATPE